jgi:hypothetical protein
MAKRKPGASIVKILLQNDRVRLAEMTIKPGDRGRLVERPDRVRYILKGGKIREHFADGSVKKYHLKPGTAQWEKKSASSMENVGRSVVRFITVQVY